MTRHSLVIIAGSVVTASCATMHSAGAPRDMPPPPIPFAASSMPSTYGIQLRLEGSVVERDGWLYVVVPTGSVRTYQGTADVWDLMVRAGLAVCDDRGEWRLVSESRAARIAPLVGLTRDGAVLGTTVRVFTDTLRLDLGIPRGTRLDHATLTFEPAWPISGVLATYTVAANAALSASSTPGDAKRPAEARCRG